MTDLDQFNRSRAHHPAGKRRVAGCMGEHSADPRHNPPSPRPQSSDFEVVLAVLAAVAAVALVAAVIVSQMWHAGLGLTGVAVLVIAVVIIRIIKENRS